ncbi:hypothetical protein J1N35_014594, partial [Gossypium stocksii]
VPKPYPRHGLTWDLKLMPKPYPRYGLTGILYRCRCHAPDMVLYGIYLLDAQAMSQTWSYRGSISHLGAGSMSQTWSYTGSYEDANTMSQTWSYIRSLFSADVMSQTWFYMEPTILMT